MFSRRSSNPLQGAGARANQIALLRFIDDITFETKLGDRGILLSLYGIDPDCRTDEVQGKSGEIQEQRIEAGLFAANHAPHVQVALRLPFRGDDQIGINREQIGQ